VGAQEAQYLSSNQRKGSNQLTDWDALKTAFEADLAIVGFDRVVGSGGLVTGLHSPARKALGYSFVYVSRSTK
jgi:hypothetical protein